MIITLKLSGGGTPSAGVFWYVLLTLITIHVFPKMINKGIESITVTKIVLISTSHLWQLQ